MTFVHFVNNSKLSNHGVKQQKPKTQIFIIFKWYFIRSQRNEWDWAECRNSFLLPHVFAPVTGRSYIVFSFQIDLNHMITPFTWNSNSKQILKVVILYFDSTVILTCYIETSHWHRHFLTGQNCLYHIRLFNLKICIVIDLQQNFTTSSCRDVWLRFR